MSVTITPTYGTDTILIKIENIRTTHKKGLFNALQEIGSDVVKEIRRLISTGSRTGRVYTYKGKTYTASAPGEPPANRSGRLLRSSRFKTRNHQEMTVGETAKYAGWVEDGTRRMAPRPHIIKAVRNEHRNSVNSILENIDRAVK